MLDIERVIGHFRIVWISIEYTVFAFFLQVFKGMVRIVRKRSMCYTTADPELRSPYQIDASKKWILDYKLQVITYKIYQIINLRFSLNSRLILRKLRSEPHVGTQVFCVLGFFLYLLCRTIRGQCAQGQSGPALICSRNNFCLSSPPTPRNVVLIIYACIMTCLSYFQ